MTSIVSSLYYCETQKTVNSRNSNCEFHSNFQFPFHKGSATSSAHPSSGAHLLFVTVLFLWIVPHRLHIHHLMLSCCL